jgi:AraC-like DNA-binding protein
MSFGRWRQHARLLRAVDMLAQAERIIDIALEVGYRSPTACSTMFQREFGGSPRVFLSDYTDASGHRRATVERRRNGSQAFSQSRHCKVNERAYLQRE